MQTTGTYTDEMLVNALHQGDCRAFTEIYHKYWKKVYVIAYNRLQSTAHAEDIAQEVFASLWANRHETQIEALENYLATATKYMVLNTIRRIMLSRKYDQNQRQVSSVCHKDPESTYQYKQILHLLELEIEKLPEKCRLIFKYSRHDGLPVKQIAAKLNIAPKTVENQIHKALKTLKLASRSFLLLVLYLFF